MKASHLKSIAFLAMLIDHIGVLIFQPLLSATHEPAYLILYQVARAIGRLAFPLFIFLLWEGFNHTRNIKRYASRLLIFGIISQVPYSLALQSWTKPNIYFTLLYCLGVLYLHEELDNRYSGSQQRFRIYQILLTAVLCLPAIPLEYSYIGPLLVSALYITSYPWNLFTAGFITGFTQHRPYGGLAFLLIPFYNGQKGWQPKWFNYAFYPGHFLILTYLRTYHLDAIHQLIFPLIQKF